MTAKELIEALTEFPDDAEVKIEAWYEDFSPATPEIRAVTTRPARVVCWRDKIIIITEKP